MTEVVAERETEDALLLSELRDGRAHAFERLMRRYNRLLFRAARGVVRNDAEAQDVLQEAWLKAFLALDGFRGEAALGTWLTRIVLNEALTHQRRRGRVVLWNDAPRAQEEDGMGPSDADDAMGTDFATPESLAARSQLRRLLEHAIDTLPPIYRVVFILRAVQGLDLQETAQALQVSQDVVKTRFLRARGMLRQRLPAGLEGAGALAHDFDGRRCDEMVAAVLARLRALGVVALDS